MTSSEWLALGIDVGGVFDDDLGRAVLPGKDERLCPAFLGVCMGWSWALHMAQEIVSHQVSQTENFDKSDQIRDKQVAPLLQHGRPVLGIYVDNVAIIGGVPEDADKRMRAVCERFGQLGIPFAVTHGRSQAHLDTIGLRFDFARRELMHKSRRCWRLRLATLALLRRRKVRGSVSQVWGGHVIHHFSLLRPGMSCLHSFYRFIEFAGDNQKVLWPSVRQEMRLVIGLLFLGEAHLGAPIHENVYLGDSSAYGFSLMVTKSSQQEVRQATLHRERWRFIISPPPGLDGHHLGDFRPRGSCLDAGVGTRTKYGQQLLQQAERRPKPVQSWRPSRAPRPLVDVPNSIPTIGPEWDKQDRYTLLVAAPWQHTAEHINIKEMRVLLMGVRRCCRDRSALGHKVLLLKDNLVSVLVNSSRLSDMPLNLRAPLSMALLCNMGKRRTEQTSTSLGMPAAGRSATLSPSSSVNIPMPKRRPYGSSCRVDQVKTNKRGRVLCAKDSAGVLLPRAKQLQCRKVTSNTLARYHSALVEFEKWAKKNRSGMKTHKTLDSSMVEFMRQQYEAGRQSWEGSYLVFGYQLLRHTGLDSACLPESKKALKGWKTGAPGRMRLPYPEEVILDVADFAVDNNNGEAALAISLQLDGYLRPSEAINLTAGQVMPPARKAGRAYSKSWGIVLAPSEEEKPTKTGHFDDCVLIGDIQHEWLGPMLELIVQGKRPEERLFPSLTLASYERLFRDAMQKRFNNCIHATPHSVRHSGPSNDRFHKRRSLQQIQKRGRWASPKSVARYEKEALLLGIWRSIPDSKHAGISARARDLPLKLLRLLQKVPQ
ncbi:unnamed protein product [Polarella glacialis]|uniref:Uncharacterized protein n=1 Tax=Polarella glacialis TaxID=89957 RepID=A0A813KBS6_POLGL|nr:unnamed protein product [Polarella glacialis]